MTVEFVADTYQAEKDAHIILEEYGFEGIEIPGNAVFYTNEDPEDSSWVMAMEEDLGGGPSPNRLVYGELDSTGNTSRGIYEMREIADRLGGQLVDDIETSLDTQVESEEPSVGYDILT